MSAKLMSAALQAVSISAAPDPTRAPNLLNPQKIFHFRDYPKESLSRHDIGIVSVLLHVSVDGKVTSCDITESSGFRPLDAKTCSLFTSRARFDPARDATGSAVPGEFRSATAWGLDDRQPTTSLDVPLRVSTVPSAYQSPVKALLVFDAAGRLGTCEITTSSGSNAADKAACDYIKTRLVIAAPKSAPREIPAAAVRYMTASLSKSSFK